MRVPLVIGAACLLAGCASNGPRLNTESVTSKTTPIVAASQIDALNGQIVHWGGRIISVDNRPDSTQLQVLSYPLARSGRPLPEEEPTGRFVMLYSGFLEPLDFRPGRLVSVVGGVRGATTASIGDVELLLPVVTADQFHLWEPRRRPRIVPHFGVGVSIGL